MKRTFFLIILLMLAACGGDPPECELNSDCSASGKCYEAECDEGKCQKVPITNCCGNKMCEKDNDENICSCTEDCAKDDADKCDGKVLLNPGERTAIYGDYLMYECDSKDKCMITYDDTEKRDQTITYEKESSYFALSIKTSYPKPFDINEDKVRFEISLKNIHEDLIPPIKFDKVQLKKSTILFGENNLNHEMAKVGDTIVFESPIDYEPELDEVKKTLTSKIDLTYTYVKNSKTGEQETKLYAIEKGLTEQFYLINPGGERD